MSDSARNVPEYALGHEGPTLLDFRIDAPVFDIGMNGPHLLFTALELRTSLHLQDGCDAAALRKLANGFTVTAHCGHSAPEPAHVGIAGSHIAPYLKIDPGPPSMYMSLLRFETASGATFAELCEACLNPRGRPDYSVALVPMLNEDIGHGEHADHGPLAAHGGIENFATTELRRTIQRPGPRTRIGYVLEALRRRR